MSAADIVVIAGCAVAIAGFVVLCLMLFWGRNKAPNYWDEQGR